MGVLNAGDLDRRITLQQHGLTRNADNEPIVGFTTLATVWASVEYTSDVEKVRAAQVGATVSVRFQIRYSNAVKGIDAKDRVIYQDKTFDIVGVKELGRREGIEISAVASADA